MKSALPPMKIVTIRNYLLCELFSNRYILTQQTVRRSTWLQGYGLHPQFVDKLYQYTYSLEFRLFLFLLLGVCLLSIIPSQCEVLQIKQNTLEMQLPDISDYFAKGIYWLIRATHCRHLLRIQGICIFNTKFYQMMLHVRCMYDVL